MFLRRLSPAILNLVNKPKLITSSALLRNSKCFATTKSNEQSIEELFPFDYDTIPSQFEDQIYKDLLKQEDAFGVANLINIKELFDNRCHLGHKTGSLNDFMKPYVFGERQDITIFDLNITAEHLKKALNFTAHVAFRDGIILFVNPAKETAHLVEKAALECGEYSNCRDFTAIMFLDPEKYYQTPVRLPDLVILFKTQANNFQEHSIIQMAAKTLIPLIAITDSNCDPRLVTYPIPANDDTSCSIALFSRLFKEAVLLGKEKRKELIKQKSLAKKLINDVESTSDLKTNLNSNENNLNKSA